MLALLVWRGIQEGKKHSRREIFGLFSIPWNFKFSYYIVIPVSWRVHRYPWFQNQSINMARAEADRHKYRQTWIVIDYTDLAFWFSLCLAYARQKIFNLSNFESLQIHSFLSYKDTEFFIWKSLLMLYSYPIRHGSMFKVFHLTPICYN